MRVLVVEDEAVLAEAIARGLRREGIAVDIAPDGAVALEKASTNGYDVVVLDRDLPVVHGDDVCRTLIDSAPAPGAAEIPRILMLTASGDLDDRVEGLMLGADDYLGKPFAFAELVARIRALSRRGSLAVKPVLEVGDIVLDPGRRYVTRAGRPLPVTRKELAVLEVLIRAGGAVVSPEQLLERVWDEHADPFTNTIRVTVGNLRRKLGDPPVIETVVGSGYRVVAG
ncbi:MAG TPA: response regulator transcription factor [Acidimicrobiia bacterium]|nr:response regulator transcription factor [Acidimicrobiia bacterium]